MTTPPQPSQGPYGPPPPPSHGSYGPPAAAPGVPQQPYGFPQQPPGPPQQGGWGQPGIPAGGGPGAGGWPPQGPQPPRRTKTGLIVGIAVGALLVAGGIVFGVTQLADKGSDLVYPKAEYELLVEKQLLDGEFSLTQDLSETEGKEIEETPDASIRDANAIVAQYGSDKGGVLVLSGMHGRLASPGFMRGKIMEGAAEGDGAKLVVPPKKFTPAGYDITIECQVVQSKEGVGVANIPMCAWGDDSTAAMVALIRPESILKSPRSIDLAEAAAETAKVREEARKPIG
ncbi:hypothetical protein CIB93_12530 [Streptomyces sp. WZ.A104]|uniref:hypothetical protein n=1 Tax=Streptomyces sp. WZ.A104 TaxID=2023771 RepID=UPI000BBCEB52|nr:hypothetical protein [Streptomyces sp. WZ.A104]PCG85740.1 hypothetical protein CIB93_12530 [Streptomyces sp. WZ.A104]